jgi:hypothetical protein
MFNLVKLLELIISASYVHDLDILNVMRVSSQSFAIDDSEKRIVITVKLFKSLYI